MHLSSLYVYEVRGLPVAPVRDPQVHRGVQETAFSL